MAENKKSFVLYTDMIHTIEKLPDNKAGKLFKHILEYVNDRNPVTDDIIVQIAFEPIKQQLKRDLVKFEEKKRLWSEAGKKSAEAKKSKKSTKSTSVENVGKRSTESTVSVNDSVSVNVTVSDSVINNHQQHAHEVFGKKLFTEQMNLDKQNLELQLKVPRIITEKDVEEFNRHLQTEHKNHVHVSEYLKHLRNWLNTRPDFKEKPPVNGNKTSSGKKGFENILEVNQLAKDGITNDN
jgi:hypothetical protein